MELIFNIWVMMGSFLIGCFLVVVSYICEARLSMDFEGIGVAAGVIGCMLILAVAILLPIRCFCNQQVTAGLIICAVYAALFLLIRHFAFN